MTAERVVNGRVYAWVAGGVVALGLLVGTRLLPRSAEGARPDHEDSATTATSEAERRRGELDAPRPSARQRARAGTFLRAYPDGARAWFETNAPGLDAELLDEFVFWLRSRTGACIRFEPIYAGERTARFLFTCSDGQLEVAFTEKNQDPELVGTLHIGMRGAEPNPPVREVAEGALALLDAWDDERFESLFGDKFDAEEMRPWFAEAREQWGACVIEEVDLATHRGALWFLRCTNGPARLTTSLDSEDRLRRFAIGERRSLRPRPE